MDFVSVYKKFQVKDSEPEITKLSETYIETVRNLVLIGAQETDKCVQDLIHSFLSAVATLTENLLAKQNTDKYNLWFIRQEDVEGGVLDCLPPGVYICIPNDFAPSAINNLTTAVNKLLHGNIVEDMLVVKAAVTNVGVDRRINHIRAMLKNSVVLWGQHIVTNVEFCENINDAKELEKLLQYYVTSFPPSNTSLLPPMSIKVQESTLSPEAKMYWKERIIKLDNVEAYNILIKIRKALYMTGEQ